MQVGIIGFGRLGKLITQYMSQDAHVYVYDINSQDEDIKNAGGIPSSIEEICQCKIVIPFVPISQMQNVLKKIAPLLKPDALVIDVCSVKELPVQWMTQILPSNISIIGTHPMFGPDSAAKTLFGGKIVLCHVRSSEKVFNDVSTYLETHGLKVIHATPEEHDKQIAHSLLLTHFIGRGLIDFGAQRIEIDTKGFRRLLKILETVENDSWQLFEDMNKYNPYAKETRESFIKSLKTTQGKLN